MDQATKEFDEAKLVVFALLLFFVLKQNKLSHISYNMP